MFHIIPDLLSADEVRHLHGLSARMRFEDGRATNPDFNAKNNLQPDLNDGAYQESATLLQRAIARNERFRDLCFPKAMGVPMICKYEAGMAYGEHVDAPLIRSTPAQRIDISCTIFLADPQSYDGGELVIRLGSSEVAIKEKPGAAVFYPSTYYHRVAPVTRGVRLVAITFVESLIRDAARRELITELQDFLHENGSKLDAAAQMKLEYVRTNLTRMWYGD